MKKDADLAVEWGISLEKFHELRRARGWPGTRFGRFEWRFTPEQVEAILAMQAVAPSRPAPTDGRTGRSVGSKRAS